MTRKTSKRPPLEKETVRARLQRALDEQLCVSVRRWIPDSDRIDGYVVGLGETWIALAELDGVRLDGWCLLRRKDVQAVVIDPDAVATKVLVAQGDWPPPVVDLDLDDVVGVLRSASEAAPLLTIHVEHDRPDICWLGSVTAIEGDTMNLWEVTTLAEWSRGPRAVDLEDVTRVGFGGSYEVGLASVAGPRPAD